MAKKRQELKTLVIFRQILIGMALIHAVVAVIVGGPLGYIQSLQVLFHLLVDQPWLSVLVIIALGSLYFGLDAWRHPKLGPLVLPPYPLIDDLRFRNDLYIGSGWTREGKQPGDPFDPAEDEFLGDNPHVILKEKGLFGNLHVKGGVGGGKTSTFIMPVVHQMIAKWPVPPPPSAFQLGPNGVYLSPPDSASSQWTPPWKSKGPSVDPAKDGPIPSAPWYPYVGLNLPEAETKYAELLAQHQRHKWGGFIIDPKGDMTEEIRRMAALYGRSDDVVVLEPLGENTYNPLQISANPLVQSEMVMDGIEAVAGQAIQAYWRNTQSEWLSNALAIIGVADPHRKTFRTILKFARSESVRTAMVSEAQNMMEQAQAAEERSKRLGQPYDGLRVNPGAIDYFRQWDDSETDVKQKQAVVSGIQAQAKFFVEDELAPFLCPELPPTFEGFDKAIDAGQIVVLRMPLGKWSAVAKVLGILVLADAQQAARDRINKPNLNQDRVLLYCVDEIANYLNRLTKEFISMNRQSRVCFLASHQSQGQLIMGNDRSFETSFNDNLRTKISYSAPNAESARRESMLFGARSVFKESWSQSESFSDVTVQDDPEMFKPGGPASRGGAVRIEAIDKPWFDPEAFISLRMGELILSEFDGVTTLPPRRVKAPAWFASPQFAVARGLEINLDPRRPHPLVEVRDLAHDITSRDGELLQTAWSMAGFAVIELVADGEGALAGLRAVLDVGTFLVPWTAVMEDADRWRERLADPQTLVVLPDLPQIVRLLTNELGATFDRVLDLPTLSIAAGESPSWGDRIDLALADQLSWNRPDMGFDPWAWCLDHGNRRPLVEDSRRIIDLFTKWGSRLDNVDDEALEQLYEQVRLRITVALEGPDPLELAAEAAARESLASNPPVAAGSDDAQRGNESVELNASGDAVSGEKESDVEAGEKNTDEAPDAEIDGTAPPAHQGSTEDPVHSFLSIRPRADEEGLDPTAGMSFDPDVENPMQHLDPLMFGPPTESQITTVTDDDPDTMDVWGDEPMPIRATPLPTLLRRRPAPDAVELDALSLPLTQSVDADSLSPAKPEPRRQKRSRNTSSTRRTPQRRGDSHGLDFGDTADAPALQAPRKPSVGPSHGDSDLQSGAPLD